MPMLLAMALCVGRNESANAMVMPHYHPTLRLSFLPHRAVQQPSLALYSTTSSASSDTHDRALAQKEMALHLMEENAMPSLDENIQSDADHPLSCYDEDHQTPVESEFLNMMNAFLTYSQQDIQSMTTTSTRYLGYPEHSHGGKHRSRQRSKEGGIRYRALYSGVQAASMEPAVLRSFTVLFEDYLPIRLAGRRIFRHLRNTMEEVQEEREGEIARARELCPAWDDQLEGGQDVVVYARRVWDALMDEGLLLDHSLEAVSENEQSQEGGVLSLPQLIYLGIDQVLILEGLTDGTSELERAVRLISYQEYSDLDAITRQKSEHDAQKEMLDGKYLEMTFPVFMKLLYQLNKHDQSGDTIAMLEMLEQKASSRADGLKDDQDTSTLLAAKAVNAGTTNSCEKRKKFSRRFDEYVAAFKLWEERLLGNNDPDIDGHLSRRMEILQGCFFGARNAKVVSALKIVYMDYRALRLAGDLIFKLMSAIAK
ncbi:hypothetical protein ACHAWF_004983 [Thalassiosira exigua]